MLNQKYLSEDQALVNYDWVDVFQNTGYVTFYTCFIGGVGSIISNPFEVGASRTGANQTFTCTSNYFNNRRVMNGDVILTIPYINDTTNNRTIQYTLSILHADTTETTLLTATATTSKQAAGLITAKATITNMILKPNDRLKFVSVNNLTYSMNDPLNRSWSVGAYTNKIGATTINLPFKIDL